jgi:hypothetical protein
MPTVLIWLPVMLCLLLMLACGGGLMLLRRSQDGRVRPRRRASRPDDRVVGLADDGARSTPMGNTANQHPRVLPAWPRRRTVTTDQSGRWWTARWLVGGLLVALIVAGCSSDQPAAPSAHIVDDPGVVHVHGLGINPADGVLYAATHTGLFTVRDGAASRVANRYQDTMGFTVVGANQFLGSGHPDARDPQLYQPGRRPLLGLIESRDAGRSWQPLSLLGEADFHALQVAHGRVYGYDATGGRFMVSGDRRQWQVRSKQELAGFAVSPDDPELVVAATEQGLARSRDGGRRWQPIGGPAAVLLDWERPDGLWAMTGDGQVWQSRDAGQHWVYRGKLNGKPEALLAHGADLYVAVAQLGIVTSADRGRTWRVLYQPALPAG